MTTLAIAHTWLSGYQQAGREEMVVREGRLNSGQVAEEMLQECEKGMEENLILYGGL